MNCDGKRWNVTWVRWVAPLPEFPCLCPPSQLDTQVSTIYILYIYICILVGGIPTPLKNIRQLGWWNSQYMENIIHVLNHQPVYIYISPRYFLWLKPICLLHLSSKYREKSTIRSSWGSGCAPGHQPCSTTNCNALKVLRGSHLTELSIDMCIICQ